MATITVDRSINADDAFSMSGGTPCFVALPTNSATYQSNLTGISTWVTGTISATTNWQSICYGNNLVVAVSSTTSTICATSPAGVSATWTTRTLPISASWYQVAYGAGVFCAVTSGLGSATNAAATSVDGVVWTSRNMNTAGNWQAMCFGNGKFVALSSSTTDINYSSDGITWSAATTTELSASAWSSVVWGGDKFVALATGTSAGAYSTDGITWHAVTMPSSSNWKSITYGNSTFVAISNTTGTIAAYSANGTSWTSCTLPTSLAWVSVAFGNNLFTAIASGSTAGGTYSYDGINWVPITTLSQTVACMCYTPTTWNSNDTLAITNNATVTVNTSQNKFWNAVTLTNGKLRIENTSTTTGIRFTMGRSSGATASSITPGSGIGDIEIAGNWIQLGTGDGTSAQTMTAPFTDYVSCLWVETAAASGVYEVWLNATGSYGDTTPLLTEGLSGVGSGVRGKFFIQQANAGPYGPYKLNGTLGSYGQKLLTLTSTTGLYPGAQVYGPGLVNAVVNKVDSATQIEVNVATATEVSPDWAGVAYGNSVYVAVSSNYSNVAATSSDGITWTKRTLPFIADWDGICYGATTGLFVAVASHLSYGVAYCATSPDGITWTQRAMPSLQNWTAVATNGTSFVAVGWTSAGAVTTAGAYSADGVTWVATVMTSRMYFAVAWGNSMYVAVGSDGTTSSICYDADGAGTWSAGATMSANTTYRGIAYGGTTWVVISGASTGSQWKVDPTTGTFAAGGALPNSTSRGIAWDGTNFVVVSTTNSVLTARSTNAVAWTSTTLLASQANNYTAICANSTTLVAVASSSLLKSNSIVSTNSGNSWADNWSSVAYGNVGGTTATYVRVAQAQSNKAAYSTDGGSTWTSATLPFVADWTSVCWGATTGLFVAVASNLAVGTALCATSPTGATWTQQTMPSTKNWTSVASNGTTYVAVCKTAAGGTTSGIASSTNGTTWVAATTNTAQIWNAVAYGGGRYVAVCTGTVSNYDADGAGTWSVGATLTSATYKGLVYNGSNLWMAVSGSSTGSQYKADPTTGSFTAGGALPNSTSSGVAWDGTNFVVVSTTNSTFTARSTNGAAWTSTYLTNNQTGSWNGICNNGTTLMAISNTTNFRDAHMTSTDSGATWTTPAISAGMPTDVTLVCFNPYVSQLTNVIEFGDGVNGNKVPTGAKVRCPNIMFTADTPANLHTASRGLGANMVLTNAGSLSANICLFDESYNTFTQAEFVALTYCGFTIPPLLTECYGVTINSIGFGIEPARRYFQFSATLASSGWFGRDSRYGSGSANAWSYINGAIVNDFNMAVCEPHTINGTGNGSVTSPNAAFWVTYTDGSTWTNLRFYGLNISRSSQVAMSCSTLFNNNTVTGIEAYGLGPIFLGVSTGNTVTNITYSEDMFHGMKSFVSAARIGNEPIGGGKLVNNTKYYIKTRTFKDWSDRTSYYEGRTVSATPFLGEKFHPQSVSAFNSATRTVTVTWVRRDPASAVVSYSVFRGTSPGFTRDSSSLIFYTPTNTVVTYANGFVAQFAALSNRRITFNQAGRTIAGEALAGYSFITDGFVAGANVVVTGSTSNNGTFMILSVAANTITLTTNHTNLVNEVTSTTTVLNGQVPTNGSTYYYRLQKYDNTLTFTTNCSGTSGLTNLTTSGNFNTGAGTIINCEGTAGSNKIRIPVGSTTNFYAGNVIVGLPLSATGVGTGATVTSIDSPWQITVSVVNSADFTATTISLGLIAGMYIYGPGIAWPTKITTINSATSITVDTAFIATFTNQTVNFMYGSESSEIEVYVNGVTTPAFNYLAYPDDFSNSVWVKTNLTVTVDQRVPPSQVIFSTAAVTGTADRFWSIGPSAKAVQTVNNLEIGANYIYSVYVLNDANAYYIPTGQISVDTTVASTQAFTASGIWQRISKTFTATATSHNFTIQVNTEGSYFFVASANVTPGSTLLPPVVSNTIVKKAISSATVRDFTFASLSTVNTITATGSAIGSFITDGFVAGDSIIVAGTVSNDGQYVITVVAINILTVTPAQPLVAEAAPSSTSITGSVLAAAAQELALAAAWNRTLGGNDTNQGIELTLATLPASAHYTEIYLGTASNFTPTDYNRVAYASMVASPNIVALSNSESNSVSNVTQLGNGGFSGNLVTLSGSNNNNFQDFAVDINYAAASAIVNVSALSNNNVFDDFTVLNWRNYVSSSPFTLLNNANGIVLQNISFNHYDIPHYNSATNSGLGVVMKGVTGGHAEPITSATIYPLGSTVDGVGIVFTAVYDTLFHELFYSPTTGALALRFNASATDTPPYTVVSGTPTFSNTGRLYMRTAGDSMEFVWPHRIYSFSSFRDIPIKLDTYDLGQSTTTNPDSAFAVLTEYAIDTGSGYGAYKTATPTNLAAESISTTTGFFIKIKLTVRPGMMFSTQTNAFVVGEVIEGTTSGATATVKEIYKLTTTSGTIILEDAITGTFLPGELIRRASDNQTRATNVVTNGQFALFPSFNSYVDGLDIYTNSVGAGDYAGRTVSITLTNVVSGSTYYVYKTSDLSLLGSGTASSSTVTVTGVTYVADFGITVRVRKASTAPKYIPLETQATVNSAGVSVYVGQSLDPVAS